jgi:single-stranded DNA-binding protein
MNHLNSILIEGNVVGEPDVSDLTEKMATCLFYVESFRFRREGSSTIQETSVFEIEASGALGLICSEKLKDGRGVRVIGMLKQKVEDGDGKDISHVWIFAEHVELKPLNGVKE